MHYITSSNDGIVTLPNKSRILPSYKNTPNDHLSKNEDLNEIAWLNHFIHDSPNGNLFYDNSIQKILDTDMDIMLVHATLSLDAIKKSGILYPSVGCLGATIFTVPLTEDQKLHNFTQYIVNHEIPQIQRAKSNNDFSSALIGIKLKLNKRQRMEHKSRGFHYMHIGEMQYKIYQKLKKSLKNPKDQLHFNDFEKTIIQQVLETKDFLNLCYQYRLDDIENNVFFDKFHASLHKMPFLGYIYFEVLSEYIQLYQNDTESILLKGEGQLNIRHLKDLVYTISPSLANGFDLEKFKPSINDLLLNIELLDKERSLFDNFNREVFLDFIKWRLAQSIRLKVLSKQPLPNSIRFDSNKSLIGHILHRLIGDAVYMKPYLRNYDMMRAVHIWENWSSNNIAFIENAVLPRGETGINPLLSPDTYEVYLLEVDEKTEKVVIKERLNVTIATALATNSLMGSSNNVKDLK